MLSMDQQVNELMDSVTDENQGQGEEQQEQGEEQQQQQVEVEVNAAPSVEETTEESAQDATAEEPATNAKPVSTRSPQLYVGGISYSSGESDLQAYFSKFGEISKLTLSKTKKAEDGSQGHRGFAFVAYTDPAVADTVIAMKHKLGGRDLRVNKAKPKTVKIFVGGINKEKTTDDSIREYFSQFGEVEDCFALKARGFGFVTIVEDGDNIETILEQQKHEIDGTMCDVKTAKPKTQDGGQGGRGGGYGGGYGGGNRNGGYGQAPKKWGGMGGYGGGYGGYGGYGAAPQAWSASRYQPYQPSGGYGGRRRY